ncbi:MAG: hypothetical protein JO144_09980 [Actinobacteria bacterium]|nr:hypothetical protein [Actinomycetota bacterium]
MGTFSLRMTAAAACGGLLVAAGALNAGAWAQTYISLDCATSDICGVDVTTDPGTATPLMYRWAIVPHGPLDVRLNRNCDNRTSCAFWCYRTEGSVTVTVTVKDANSVVLGTASQDVLCTQQPEA